MAAAITVVQAEGAAKKKSKNLSVCSIEAPVLIFYKVYADTVIVASPDSVRRLRT